MRIFQSLSLIVFGVSVGISGIATEKSTCPTGLGAGSFIYSYTAEIAAAKKQIQETGDLYARLAGRLAAARTTEPDEFKALPNAQSPQRRGGIIALLKADVELYRRHVESLRTLLRAISNQTQQHDARIQIIEGLINDFASKLPDENLLDGLLNLNIVNQVVPREHHNPEDFRSSLETAFVELQAKLELGNLLRAFRASSKLESPEIRKALRGIVNADMEKMMAIDSEISFAGPGYRKRSSFPVYTFIGEILKNQEGISTQLNPESKRPLILGGINLLSQMFRELIRNANSATLRAIKGGATPDSAALSKTFIRKNQDGSVQVEIEDNGNPNEFLSSHALGDSSEDNMGTGRYTVQLISEFMDFRVIHSSKANGSGSIVTVYVPAGYVLGFEN